MKLFKSRNTSSDFITIDNTKLPRHIAIIMDGNGRWAKKRFLPRSLGHKAGVEAIRDVIETASNTGIAYLTLYAFSTENWNRPTEEVSALMELLVDYLRKEGAELHSNNVRINTIGDIGGLPEYARKEVEAAKELTANNTGLWVNIALNYGGRDEIIRAVKKVAADVEAKKISIADIKQETFAAYLDTADIPDPDLLIRTSGEYRFSNFLIWQFAYTEFWFTDKLWPDFNGEDLLKAIHDFQKRDRRFGSV